MFGFDRTFALTFRWKYWDIYCILIFSLTISGYDFWTISPSPSLFQKLTCSGLRPIRIDRTLEKKLARRGLRGGSFWRKPYNFISSFSSSPSLSLIWLTSEVRSSHDMLGYLQKKRYVSRMPILWNTVYTATRIYSPPMLHGCNRDNFLNHDY